MVIRVNRTVLPQGPQGGLLNASPLPAASRPIGNPAGLAAQGAGELAGLAADLFQRQRDQNLMTQLAELDMERRRADADVLGAYGELTGKAAVEQRAEAMRALEANSTRIRRKVTDKTLAGAWAQQDAALSASATARLDLHFRRENTRWQVDTQAARAELLAQDLGRVAFGEGYDPATGRLSDEAERTRSAYLDAIGTLGQLQGWSSERVEAERRKVDGAAMQQVAHSLLAEERFDEADALLKAHGDKLDPRQRDRIAAENSRRRGDRQAFEAARWAEQQPGGLVQQIEALNRFVEGDVMSLEVRDQAERRLRAAEDLQWQDRMRGGNAALEQMEQFAQLNRTGTYDALPIEMRQQLEATGRDVAAKNWFQQGGQFVTTTEGMDFMLRMDDDAMLRATRDELQAARMFLSPGDLAGMLNRWDRLHGAVAKASSGAGNLPEGLIEESITTRMQDLGMLKVDEAATPEDVNRRKRLVFEVKKMAAMRPGEDPQKLIEEALKDTLYVDDRELPILTFTPAERDTGYYQTSDDGLTPYRQVPEELVKNAIDENRKRNAERMAHNAKAPPGQQEPLLPEDRPTILRNLTSAARQRERDQKAASNAALQWMQRRVQRVFPDGRVVSRDDAWHTMPEELRAALRQAGVEDVVRTRWMASRAEPPTYSPYGGGPAGGGLFRGR